MIRRSVSVVCLVAGLILLVISLIGSVGLYSGIPPYTTPPKEAFDPKLFESIRSYAALKAAVRQMPDGTPFDTLTPEAKMKRIYDVVTVRFTRAKQPIRHTIFTNWILWAVGQVSTNASFIRNSDILLRYSTSGFCSELSFLALRLAEDAGIPTRHVGLYGHVVMEAYYDGGWHMYDPYAEVIPMEGGRVLSVTELEGRQDLVKEAYKDDSAALIPIFQNLVRANFVAYPPEAQFVWKAQLLYVLEPIAQWLKYLGAILLMVAGLWGLATDRGRRRLRRA